MRRLPLLMAVCLGCRSDDPVTLTGTDTTTPQTFADGCAGTPYAGTDICEAWVRNPGGETAPIVDGGGTETDITALEVQSIGGEDFIVVSRSGFPSYTVTLTAADIEALNGRPNAASDFVTGQTTATAGQTVQWGADIGFRSDSQAGSCPDGAGYGWWPPGPECPYDQSNTATFPASPRPATSPCETGLGASGTWVNGVSIYNWADGFAYDDDGVWMNLAPAQEVYDLGLCGGHAAGGDYHHHSWSACLADVVGDVGGGHSPIYGFAADGYPIHGPWHASGVEAESCWIQRDYDDPSDPFGCGGTGERSCVMVDPYDPSQGTEPASAPGPRTTDTVTSLSRNEFPGTMGLYTADFWYDAACAASGGPALDAHNGHDHDGLGYHYHITFTYPFTMGPRLYGEVPDAAGINCNGVRVGGGPPGP